MPLINDLSTDSGSTGLCPELLKTELPPWTLRSAQDLAWYSQQKGRKWTNPIFIPILKLN